uniref:DUF5406 family protein n=2 Tax=Enterococcus faecium TaxID=1352 RepID=UPI002852A3E0|nr:DUF5406 family protein [Enterococcus faecium]WLE91400.1 hypothetical protein FOCLOMLH_00001 [Enterococcus faecium]
MRLAPKKFKREIEKEAIYYGEVDEEISSTKDLLDFLDKNKDTFIVLTDYEEVTTNCKGLDVLALDEDDLYDQKLTDNPIGFGLLPEDDEGNEWFKMTLTDDNGDELSVEDTWSYLSDYIVSVEIIEFVADKEE